MLLHESVGGAILVQYAKLHKRVGVHIDAALGVKSGMSSKLSLGPCAVLVAKQSAEQTPLAAGTK